MKMYYCQTPHPNFGDELNVWMWSRLLPEFFDEDDSTIFLGIGSILFDFFPDQARKVVFGAGYGGYTPMPRVDGNWQFYFVRGKLTAQRFGLDPALAVGDAAILLRSCVGPQPAKKHKASFIPHWESTLDGRWPEACAEAGLHYIDPCGSVESVLADIRASDMVVAEAMHGAIVSDALRVPWVAVEPIQPKHRMKWFDWASALDLNLHPAALAPSSGLEFAVGLTGDSKRWADRLRRRAPGLKGIATHFFRDRAAAALSRLAARAPNLSSDIAIERAHSTMLMHLERLRRNHLPQEALHA